MLISVDDVFMILNNIGYQCLLKDNIRYVKAYDMGNSEHVSLFLFDQRKLISSSMPTEQINMVKEDFLRNTELLGEGFENA